MNRPVFVPWARTGLIAAVTNIDPLTGELPRRATFTVSASVNGRPGKELGLRLLGPADFSGLDPENKVLAVRSQPTDNAIEVEPNYFCTVDLFSPYAPWLFTPAAPNKDRLRPWLVLVVVSARTSSLDHDVALLPVLHVGDVSLELPDLSQSYAWAHAQVTDPADLTADTPVPTSVSRLLCPRQLESRTTYIAAVVPAFDLGRLAGLGLPVPPSEKLRPAWDVTVGGPLDLPVHHWWTFTTGDDGDYQSLVSRLRRMELTGETVTGRNVSVPGEPGFLPPLPGWQFPGALGLCPDPLPGTSFTTPLVRLIDGQLALPGHPLPPPLYGRWHAADPQLGSAQKPWLRRLNLDPRYRAAAAVGTRLVQEHQETLMTAAWQQIGQVEAANALLRQGQLARHAGTVLHQRLAALPSPVLLQIASPALTRVVTGTPGRTIAAQVAASRIPPVMLSAAFRRILRPRGPLGRHSGADASGLLTLVNDGEIVVTARPKPDGLVSLDDGTAPEATPWCAISPELLLAQYGHVRPPASSEQWGTMIKLAAEQQRRMPPCEPDTRSRPALPVNAVITGLIEAIRPSLTIPARMRSRIKGPPGWQPADPLEPIMAAPRIDTPVVRDLVALAPDLLLPGIADLPNDAVSAVSTNRRFIEALMVGINHEMARELLWRGYPTDQRGTCMHRFWDKTASLAGPADDIPDIDHRWDGELGTHVRGDTDQVVLLIRGEVLRRYPKTVVYAARAEWANGRRRPVQPTGSPPEGEDYPERYPAFSGTIPPDITYVGFDLPTDARGDAEPAKNRPGWFFVLQQPPAQSRFGLNANVSANVLGTGPGDLSWPAVSTTSSGHIDLTGPLKGLTVDGWGPDATSADLAAWTEQKPYRVCIHASDLLPLVAIP